jgi:hypothetical protein
MKPRQNFCWKTIYEHLNALYHLHEQHGVTLGNFMQRPGHYQYWIQVYFANAALLINRPHGATIKLSCFLQYPDEILLAVFNADQLAVLETNQAMPSQPLVVMAFWTDTNSETIWRNGQYVQPLHHKAYRRRVRVRQ